MPAYIYKEKKKKKNYATQEGKASLGPSVGVSLIKAQTIFKTKQKSAKDIRIPIIFSKP